MQTAFRPVTGDDIELLLAWRANPDVYEGLYEQSGPYEWERFWEWWQDLEDVREWIVMVREAEVWRDVGLVRLLELDTSLPEIGVYVGEVPLWGSGIGTEAVEFALDWLREAGYESVRARILTRNEASITLFERVGFTRVGDAREDESDYRMSLD